MSGTVKQAFRLKPKEFLVGGHRGMGENFFQPKPKPNVQPASPNDSAAPVSSFKITPPWRENTLSSFAAAHKTGVRFVEFDVQVTADDVPVLFHDDMILFSEGPEPSPTNIKAKLIHELTLLEFRELVPWPLLASSGNAQVPLTKHVYRHFRDVNTKKAAGMHLWSCDSDVGVDAGLVAPSSRTEPGAKLDGAEEASRSLLDGVNSSLPTLEEMFQKLPTSLGFNIEIKMCNLAKAPDSPYDPSIYPRGLAYNFAITPAEEIERVLTPILKVVNAFSASPADDSDGVSASPSAGVDEEEASSLPSTSTPPRRHCTGQQPDRVVFFSSFDPDICAELRRRQSQFPVLFLSGCGIYPLKDARCLSAQAALDFARAAGLTGLVVPAEVLLTAPRSGAGVVAAPDGGDNGKAPTAAEDETAGGQNKGEKTVQRSKVDASWLPAACQEAGLELLTYGDENMDVSLTGRNGGPTLYGNLPGVTGAITDRADFVMGVDVGASF